MPVPGENVEGVLPDDQFIVSYPRSGNTWLRQLLCDLVLQRKFGVELQGLQSLPSADALMPDIHVHNLVNPTQAEFGMTERIFKSHNLSHLRGCRMVYLFRSPADALVSYYHLNLRRPELRERAQARGLESFCRSALSGWRFHLESALEYHREAPSNVLLLNYGRLLENGVAELARAAEFVGLASEDANLNAAIERCSFARLRKREEQNPKHPEEYFYRKGRQGTGRDELSEATWNWISSRGDSTYERALTALEESLKAGAGATSAAGD
jgi:hypothetical protein